MRGWSMRETKIIPVVFASDDNYAPYLGVALYSLIENTNPDHEYHIYVFYRNMSLEHRRRIQSLEKKHVQVKFIDISVKNDWLNQYKTESYFTVETTFRLFIPELLPEYDKVLYVDCDMIILDDVAKLFEIDLGNSVVAGAHMAVTEERKNYWEEHLKISLDSAFNAGFLLIHCPFFVKEKIKEKCLAMLQEDWEREQPHLLFPDQDALNISCSNKVTHFPMHWNFEWLFSAVTEEFGCSEQAEKDCLEAVSSLKLIHYDSYIKPWNQPERPLAQYFWYYAKKTEFYEEIMMKSLRIEEQRSYYKFPWEKVPVGSAVVIYGAGAVGKDYLLQMRQAMRCFLVAVCDRNASKLKQESFLAVHPEELPSMDFDYLVIAVLDDDMVVKIKESLLFLGIDEKKIVWKD